MEETVSEAASPSPRRMSSTSVDVGALLLGLSLQHQGHCRATKAKTARTYYGVSAACPSFKIRAAIFILLHFKLFVHPCCLPLAPV